MKKLQSANRSGSIAAYLRCAIVIAIAMCAVPCARAQSAEDWPMGRGNTAGTGATTSSLESALDLLWEVENEGLGYDTGPIIADGMVFAADADGEVLALKLEDGSQLWKLSLDSGFMSTPSYQNGVLFIGDCNGLLRALDAKTGEEKWQYKAEMEIDGGANFYEDMVLFTSQSGTLYALDVKSGELKWKYETGDQLQCGATLAGDRTFLGGCDAHLHIIDVKTGQNVGEPLPIDSPTGSTPSVYENTVLVPTYSGEIFAFKSPSNEVVWRFKDPELSSEFKNSVAVADGLLVATSRNRRVFALDMATGKVKWEQTLRKRSDASPVIAGDKVVLAAADGRIILLELKSGEELWMFEVKGSFLGAPAVAHGKVVVASDRGTIYCLGKK
jgi:outer membrane protein assembly factor BamB